MVEELHLVAVAVADLIRLKVAEVDRPRGLAGADLARLFGEAGAAVAERGRLGTTTTTLSPVVMSPEA
ncbi:MAG TPA: hypothetical protein PKM23_08040, partial [bacterium]|nr:hypothetical protein [bacterium]